MTQALGTETSKTVVACSRLSWVGECSVSCLKASAISVDSMGSECGMYGCQGVTDPSKVLCSGFDPLLLID